MTFVMVESSTYVEEGQKAVNLMAL